MWQPKEPLTGKDLQHLLEKDEFSIVRDVDSIPDDVKKCLARDFQQSEFQMANPDGEWQAGCVIADPHLPRRRLVFGADSGCHYLLQFETLDYARFFHILLCSRSLENGVPRVAWHSWSHCRLSDISDFRRAFTLGTLEYYPR